jgi:four helix bundle protein
MALTPNELAARTKGFADRVLKFARALPYESRMEGILQQLIDSSSSASANYRAARRARSRKEFIAKLGVVVEEADESENWLETLDSRRHRRDAGAGDGVGGPPERIARVARNLCTVVPNIESKLRARKMAPRSPLSPPPRRESEAARSLDS